VDRKPGEKQDILSNYTLLDFPKEIQKKVTLLQHFRSYLEGEAKSKPQIVNV
jgi:polo-like kinase 1